MQKSRFTASKPSIFAIASDEKFIRHLVASFHQRSLSQSQYQNDPTKPNFGTLTATTYGNGAKVSSRYDDFNRVTGVVYGEETAPRYEYDYNAKGQVARVRDNLLNRTTQSEYDLANRPVRVKTAEAGQHVYTGQVTYDNVYGNLSEFTEKVGENRQEYGTKFGYDDENRPTSLTYSIGATTIGQSTTTIDKLNRTTFSAVKLGSKTFTSEYHFAAGGYGTGSVTNLVSSITQPGCNCGYGYDDNGNIASATLNGKWTGYTYDALGQLIRVNDRSDTSAGDNGSTWVYEYDRGGNILSKKLYPYANTSSEPLQTMRFSYGNANWKDQLTAVDGTPITYDAIGNPLSDGTWTYTWQNGRQLQKMQKSGVTAEFVYNADGLRVQKTVNGVATKYTLHGKNVVHMTSGTDELHFFYDAQNRPAVVVYNGTAYAYVKSLQGDIVALLNGAGNVVVSYVYDAWGAPIGKSGSMAETLGSVQPFRYRGYVFDEETGLYYLRSRYYNPRWGRFVNADTIVTNNLFLYCLNSPNVQIDSSGCSSTSALFSTVLCDNGGGASRYNRQKAVDYAREWYDDRNNEFYSYSDLSGDCTNFTSQCLYAGGIPMDSDWHSIRTEKNIFKRIFQKPWNWFKNNGYYEWDISRAWQTVSAQYEYIKENYCGGKEIIITSPDEIEAAIANNLIQAGDLLYFKAGTALHHSVIITQVTNNMIYYAGHTDSYFDKPLNEGMETDSVVILHLQE